MLLTFTCALAPIFQEAEPEATPVSAPPRPNIVFIMADDLGYAELGCFGQTKIETPHLDALATEGVRFTQHYSGSPVCAPSRCVLMTGLHTGHSHVRDNRGAPVVGQLPIPDESVTVAELLQAEGYTTACIGKWGLGGPETTGLPNLQGFDHWFGYLDQWNAHTHYPEYLWRNDEKVMLEGNAEGAQGQYSQDLFTAEAIDFLAKQSRDEPFFLYVPYAVPHVSLHVPEESLAQYADRWEETPYPGAHYSGHEKPRAAYAAMVSHMDRDIGSILAKLDEMGLADNTLVIFTSDNGPTYAGGADSEFFESAGPLRGLKGSVYEGGIRVPMIARWPGHIEAGTSNDHISAFQDYLPTFVELAGGEVPEGLDGVSFVSTLEGRDDEQRQHAYLFWEHQQRRHAIRMGRWKAVRNKLEQPVQLFDLESDLGEKVNIAGEHPELVEVFAHLFATGRTPSEHFPLKRGQ